MLSRHHHCHHHCHPHCCTAIIIAVAALHQLLLRRCCHRCAAVAIAAPLLSPWLRRHCRCCAAIAIAAPPPSLPSLRCHCCAAIAALSPQLQRSHRLCHRCATITRMTTTAAERGGKDRANGGMEGGRKQQSTANHDNDSDDSERGVVMIGLTGQGMDGGLPNNNQPILHAALSQKTRAKQAARQQRQALRGRARIWATNRSTGARSG